MSNINDFVIENGILKKYSGNDTDVVIPDGVTEIYGSFFGGAFKDCTTLTSITFPNSVTKIGERAFKGCTSLTSITIPEGVKVIGNEAFRCCSSLKNVIIPESVNEISSTSFKECKTLADKNGFVIIKNILYDYYGSDECITVPDDVTEIGYGAFESCSNLKNITFPDSLKRINASAFSGCTGLSCIILPNHDVRIDYAAFYGCSNLKKITLTEPSIYGMMFGDTGKTIEMTLIRENADLITVIGAFRKAYWSQTWNYKPDFLLPLKKEDFPNYDRLVAVGSFEGFKMSEEGRIKAMTLRLLDKGNPVSAEYKNMFADFLNEKIKKAIKISEEDENPEYIRAIIEVGAITDDNKEIVKKALKKSKIQQISQLADQIDNIIESAQNSIGNAEENSNVEKKYFDRLKEINATAVLLKSGISDLPDIALADGTGIAPVQYLQLCLAEYILQYKALNYSFSLLADEVACLLDKDSLAKAIVTLYENASPESIQLTLLPAVFRYADGSTIEKVYHRYKDYKWLEDKLKNCIKLSDTKEAMIIAEKKRILESYAYMRNMDSDYIRYTMLYDFGFDENGKIIYDIGSTKIEVTLNKDFTLTLYDTVNEKIVKSIPKKNADASLYDVASKNFEEVKKNLKKAVAAFFEKHFKMFLSKTKIEVKKWKEIYLKNPVLLNIASLLVWSQNGNNFILMDGAAINSEGHQYIIGDEDIVLAHPMEMSESEVKNWQKYFVDNNIKQPFLQIWEMVISFDNVKENRYEGIKIPAYRFKNQEKHGIHFSFENWDGCLNIHLDSCSLEFEDGTAVKHRELNLEGTVVLGKFKAEKSRSSNHIIGLLDRWTIYGRILKKDILVIEMLHNATLAQLTDYIRFSTENNCTKITAALLDYRQKAFPYLNPMVEFTLE